MKDKIIQLFTPNSNPSLKILRIMWVVELLILFAWWFTAEMVILPTPLDILASFDNLAKEHNVLGELWTSTVLCLKAMGLATFISMVIAYAGKIPVFGGISWLSSKLRFLSMIGISFVFLLLFSGYNLKLSMLTFGITGFMVVSMQNMLAGIKTIEYNHARTLGMNPWQVLWEVDIKSRIHEVLTIMASNIAISWVMLSFVEGRVRSGGGIGVLMLVQEKRFDMASVFMMQLLVLTVAILMDLGFNFTRKILAPYSTLDTQLK